MLFVGDDWAEDHHAMEIVDEHGVVLALIVERRDQPAFVALLREADAEFAYDAFKPALAAVLRAEPDLAQSWNLWRGHQRWSPSAYVERIEAGWSTWKDLDMFGSIPIRRRPRPTSSTAWP